MTQPLPNNPMSSRRDRDRSFKRAVSLFMLFSMLLVLGTIWLGNTRINPFENKYRLYFLTSHVLGIQIETPVTLAGILIGKVENMEFSKDNNIRVTLRLLKRHQERIRGDSHITFNQPVFGSPSLDISLGSGEQPVLQDGTFLPLERTQEIGELIERVTPILESLNHTLRNVAALTDQWVDPQAEVQQSLRHIAELTAHTARLQGRLESDLPAVLHSAREALVQADGLMADARKGVRAVPSVLGRAGEVLEQVREIAASLVVLSRQLALLSPRVPALVQQSRDVMQEAENLMRNLNHSILFDEPRGSAGQPRSMPAMPRVLPPPLSRGP